MSNSAVASRSWRLLVTAAAAGLLLAACGNSAGSSTSSSAAAIGAEDGAGGVQPTGTVIATSGFDVARNGFAFQNYGNEGTPQNLDANAMWSLFGDQVCARIEGDTCTLAPTPEKWMKVQNDSMNGGHCFGLAGLAWALYKQEIDPNRYGAPEAGEMALEGNIPLQTDVAAVFVTQATEPTATDKITVTPNDAIEKMKQAWAAGQGYALAFFQIKDGEPTGGHAVTPVALEDRGEGKVGIVLYDNNFPKQPQVMVVDTAANTWSYSTAADPKNDPEAYVGGVDNPLELFPVTPMIGPQSCPFCAGGEQSQAAGVGSTKKTVGSGSEFNYVYLNQEADASGVTMSVTDANGQPIPGAKPIAPLSGQSGAPPAMLVPKTVPFQIRIDGSKLQKPSNADLSIIGPGYSYGVDKFEVQPGDFDTVSFDPATNSISYETKAGSAPDIVLSLDGATTSYDFLFGGLALPENGGKIGVKLDPTKQTVTASAEKSGPAEIDFVIGRVDEKSDEEFTSDPIPLEANESLIIEYGKWQGNGTSMPIGIDTNGSGEIQERLVESKPAG